MDGIEEYDAFSTLRQAKAWVADQLGVDRIRWSKVEGALSEMYRAEIVKEVEN